MSFEKIKTGHLLLILGLCILIFPPILTQTSFLNFFSFSKTGEIGDTIGGITAPFINAIGAILVFIAFKEQVKANDLIKEQQYFQHIQGQIQRLEDDFLNLPDIIKEINQNIASSRNLINNIEDGKQVAFHIKATLLNKVIYTTAVFQQTIELIEKMDHNREFMLKKINTLYKIFYQDNYQTLALKLNGLLHMRSSSLVYIADLIFQINDLEKKFAD